MPIDIVAQGGSSPIRSGAPASPVPAKAAAQRQELPGSGQPVPGTKQASQPEAVQQAVSHLNNYAQNLKRDLQFSVDDDSGRVVVKVMDADNGQVIRQIPSDEVLAIARSLEQTHSFLLSTKA